MPGEAAGSHYIARRPPGLICSLSQPGLTAAVIPCSTAAVRQIRRAADIPCSTDNSPCMQCLPGLDSSVRAPRRLGIGRSCVVPATRKLQNGSSQQLLAALLTLQAAGSCDASGSDIAMLVRRARLGVDASCCGAGSGSGSA